MCSNTDRAGPASTTLPRYITSTRSQSWRTTARLWLTKIRLVPRSRLHAREQLEDLRLDRHVQRAHRLVTHQQPRRQDHGARDGHALALPAGQRGTPARGKRGIESDVDQHRRDVPCAFGSIHGRAQRTQRLGDALCDRHGRIEAGEGILEHDLQRVA